MRPSVSTVYVAGFPDRGASTSPAIPSRANRVRHLLTVTCVIAHAAASAVLLPPRAPQPRPPPPRPTPPSPTTAPPTHPPPPPRSPPDRQPAVPPQGMTSV